MSNVRMDRRRFLAASGARLRLPGYPFSLGVASGDPLPDRVVLWTRLAPEPLAPDGRGGMPDRTVPVEWQVADLGHSVHVDVGGLAPGRWYFLSRSRRSWRRTTTTPARA
ncbi:MAG: hypothetical protein GEV03_13750 [Streptosporangiales bacterium]|nr:hypothetical protein [Streptosporangiales bacterium]